MEWVKFFSCWHQTLLKSLGSSPFKMEYAVQLYMPIIKQVSGLINTT